MSKHRTYYNKHKDRLNAVRRENYNPHKKAAYAQSRRERTREYKRVKRLERSGLKEKRILRWFVLLLFCDPVYRFMLMRKRSTRIGMFMCPIFSEYSATDKDRMRYHLRKHTSEHRAAVKRSRFARRTRLKNAVNDLTSEQWDQIKNAYKNKCAYCHTASDKPLTQDHVMPVSRGGHHTASNVVPACFKCNLAKYTTYIPESLYPNPFADLYTAFALDKP